MSRVITDEQEKGIESIIDDYLELHRAVNKNYCCRSEERWSDEEQKLKPCEGDCTQCQKEFYEEWKDILMERGGLK